MSLGVFDTEVEANWSIARFLDGSREVSEAVGRTPTFLAFARAALDDRELDGVRSIKQERSFFETHIATARWATKPLNRITTADGVAWVRELGTKKALLGRRSKAGKSVEETDRQISRATVQRNLTLAIALLNAAGPNGKGLIKSNPFRELKVTRRIGREATRETWTFLTLPEQEWFGRPRPTSHGYVTEEERLMILFGAGSGVRRGEQLHLRLDDLHLDKSKQCEHPTCPLGNRPHVVIRYGSDGLPRKNDKILYLVLFGWALEAIRAWLPLRAHLRLPGPLVFPARNGKPRAKPVGRGHFVERVGGTHIRGSKNLERVGPGRGTHSYIDRLKEVLQIAGITRNVRWHDLRHTCGSSLARGDWGDAWTLPEVKEQLGHSAVAVTERYAHFGAAVLLNASKKVRGFDPTR